MENRNKYLVPFILVTSLFFLWGIANSLNGTLIKHFQTALDLTRAQAGIVDSAFYIGYFVMAIPAGIVMRRYGYKNGILVGLMFFSIGALLFYPAAETRMYSFFLFALFVIASGLAFLETAANLYMTVLGDEKSASQRLNFAQSFNGLSIIFGPVIGSLFIFSNKEYSQEQLAAMPLQESEVIRIAEAHSVQMPYLVVAGVVFLVAVLFALTKMPEIGKNSDSDTEGSSTFGDLLKNKHLMLGVIAQFCYVGAQASIWGFFVDFKLEFAKDSHIGIVNSLYQVTSEMSSKQIANYHASAAFILFMVGRFFGTWLMRYIAPEKVLAYFTIATLVLMGATMLSGGLVSVLCLMLVYFFMSIMFPTIFALATRGFGNKEGKMASSLVIMAIVGGAILPPLTGLLFKTGVVAALLVPLACFAYILFYAIRGYKIE
jgi:MFS transporter, FHS family, L-fucose permease